MTSFCSYSAQLFVIYIYLRLRCCTANLNSVECWGMHLTINKSVVLCIAVQCGVMPSPAERLSRLNLQILGLLGQSLLAACLPVLPVQLLLMVLDLKAVHVLFGTGLQIFLVRSQLPTHSKIELLRLVMGCSKPQVDALQDSVQVLQQSSLL